MNHSFRIACIAAALVAGCTEEESQQNTSQSALVGGSTYTSKPAIGTVNLGGRGCTATLITPRHVITAAHCNGHSDALPSPATFTIGANTYTVSRLYVFGPEHPSGTTDFNTDVALLELSRSVPSGTATPMWVAAAPPTASTTSTTFGYGCNQRLSDGGFSGGGTKRSYTFSYASYTTALCPGDSGGPACYGDANAWGAIWGVNSYVSAYGDVWGDVSRYKEDIVAVIRRWDGSNFEAGFKRSGVEIGFQFWIGNSGCLSYCDSLSQCNSFSYNSTSGRCTAFSDVGDWTHDADYTSGLSTTPRRESDINRVGNDYSTHIAANNSACADSCNASANCLGYTFRTSDSRCWLKSYLGIGSAEVGVTSAIKRAPAYYTDRPGADMTDFALTRPDPLECQSVCKTTSGCVSYTYRNQVHDTVTLLAAPHCWLKSGTPSDVVSVTESAVPGSTKRFISGLAAAAP